jgi:archaellum component FlaG (FlaF/FlaG flagellin family)
VKKISGNEWAGYGMIFCAQNISNFLFAVIDLKGDFMINKVVDGNAPATPLVDWNDSQASNLFQNPGDINKLSVSWQKKTSEGYNVYMLSFNDHTGVEFIDNIGPQWSSGSCGYILAIDSMETFPTIPVEVHFR